MVLCTAVVRQAELLMPKRPKPANADDLSYCGVLKLGRAGSSFNIFLHKCYE
jgi:hypothetical protein